MNPAWVKVAINVSVEFGRRHPWVVAALVFTSPVGVAFMVIVIAAIIVTGPLTGEIDAAAAGCEVVVDGDLPTIDTLDQTQVHHAAEIIAEGESRGVPPFGQAVGIAVALQESGMRNLASQAVPESLNYPHDGVAAGDHDSVGMMQQRANWGTVEQRMDPVTSIGYFYEGGTAADGYSEHGLLDIPGWQNMSLAEAAQAVQVSAFPEAYAAHEQLAYALVEQLSGTAVSNCGEPDFGNAKWVNPIDPDGDGSPAYVNANNFGACSDLWENCHTGDDLSGIDHVPVYAASAGKVIVAGWGGAYGFLVEIDHTGDGSVVTYYAHNARLLVQVGDTVKTGDQISVSDSTGNTTGPHVHFEVRLDGEPIDPVPFMADHHAAL